LLVSLQERLEILPAALVPWRQSRSFLFAEAKARARADFVETLAESGTIPSWAYGIEPLPGFVEQFLDEILSLKRIQAIELLQLVKQQLQTLAVKHHETGVACQMTCQFIYGDNVAGWQAANNLLTKIIDADKAKCRASLQKRETTTRQALVDDESIKTHLLEGPRTSRAPRRPQPIAKGAEVAPPPPPTEEEAEETGEEAAVLLAANPPPPNQVPDLRHLTTNNNPLGPGLAVQRTLCSSIGTITILGLNHPRMDPMYAPQTLCGTSTTNLEPANPSD
jgi:hypothetical protein